VEVVRGVKMRCVMTVARLTEGGESVLWKEKLCIGEGL
jgi:hypothetical protein